MKERSLEGRHNDERASPDGTTAPPRETVPNSAQRASGFTGVGISSWLLVLPARSSRNRHDVDC